MKRTIVWTMVLVGVFSLGYLTARSPLIVHEEMPSADLIADMKEQRQLMDAYKRQIQLQREQWEGTLRFFKMVVKGAELEYEKSRTAASKARLDKLRQKLEKVQRRMQAESRRVTLWVER
jgi:polyhydroxyalkanoate synthesis regulator phasin